jgi:membrane-bound lytic murein transglycosylase MltF
MKWVAFIASIGGVAALGAGPMTVCAADAPKTSVSPSASQAQPPAAPQRQLVVANKPWKGDFDQMVERRMIRVLVPYSRTLYYTDKGRERGVTAELVRELERSINRKYAKELKKRPLTIYIVPATRDKLISGVAEGLGDIAAGNITVTEQRSQIVDFLAPADLQSFSEVVVAGTRAPPVKSVDDLSGKTVHVRKATSYHESLVALNERFRREGRPPVTLVLLPDALEDEDKMEMVNAGLLDL